MERVSDDYDRPLVEASRSALVELAYCLGAYKDALVLVGGWVPYFLLRDHQPSDVPFEHVGSIDIDIVVDPDRVGASEYASIEEIITGRDWTHLEDRPFSFIRTVASAIDGDEKDIKVDFLTTQPDRLIGRNRDREVQPDLIARPFRAAPIALDHNSEVTVDGQLPGGGVIRRNLVMADIVGCIGMKGHALDGRYKEKDAYDIVAVVENYGEGPKEVAGLIRPHVKEPLVAESLGYIGEFFSSPLAAGPRFVGDFHATELGEARQRRIQRSYQVVHALLEAL